MDKFVGAGRLHGHRFCSSHRARAGALILVNISLGHLVSGIAALQEIASFLVRNFLCNQMTGQLTA